MRRLVPLVALTLLPAGALTACGSSSSALSQSDFNTQVNKVCTAIEAQVKAITQPTGGNLAEIAPFVAAYEKAIESYNSQTAALAAKAKDAKDIQANWTTLSQSDYAMEKPLLDNLVAAAQSGDQTRYKTAAAALSGVTDHRAQIVAYQTKYGATACAALVQTINA